MEWTVGYVAGLIAFGIVVSQLWLPTGITFLLFGQPKERETAATWTVAGKLLQSSYWPFLLQSDSSESFGVRKVVAWTAMAVPGLACLVSIASVITPLGLYEQDEVDDSLVSASFRYVPDSSLFALGTTTGRNGVFTRRCNYRGCPAACPYAGNPVTYTRNNSGIFCSAANGINSTVPQILRDIYMSGTKDRKTTISNMFDIEWRQESTYWENERDNGINIPGGMYRFAETFALDDAVKAVEGLVVDGKRGGIGFRNHTLPVGHRRGSTWSEDLLFLQPDVQCIDLNVTVDFTVSLSGGGSSGFSITKMVLTDRGGFVNMNTTDPRDDSRSGINAPDLRTRAYQAAWLANGLTMGYMNITDNTNETLGTRAYERIDSKLGQEFKLAIPDSSTTAIGYKYLGFSDEFGSHAGLSVFAEANRLYPNPWGINLTWFGDAQDLCEGWRFEGTTKWPDYTTRLNNSYVMCQLIRGIPRRLDPGPANVFDDGSKWSAPVYTCASSVKAIVKQVDFFHNGTTENLEGLAITDIHEKNYQDENEMPLWGMEDSAFPLDRFDPIWGLVNPALIHFQNITTVRAPSFYLPVTQVSQLSSTSPLNNLPGAIAPVAAYRTIRQESTSLTWTGIDYQGKGSMSLWLRWKELSSSADTVPRIMQLLWTDMAASALVGSKGVLGSRNMEVQAATVLIHPTYHRVKYHWLYAIPAFVVALFLILVSAAVTGSIVLGQATVAGLKENIKRVSVGRVLTSIFYPESSNLAMEPTVWNKYNAYRQMNLSGRHPKPNREDEDEDEDDLSVVEEVP